MDTLMTGATAAASVERAAKLRELARIEPGRGGRAAGGVDTTLEAVNRGTVDRLYVLRSYDEVGRVCRASAALARASGVAALLRYPPR